MSGGWKRRQKVHKGDRLLADASAHSDFRDHIELCRSELDIPQSGFKNSRDYQKWKKIRQAKNLPVTVDASLKRAVLGPHAPPTHEMMKLLDEYLLFGSTYNKDSAPSYAPCFDIEIPSEEELQWSPQSFVKVRIYSTASRPDFNQFLNKHWSALKKMTVMLSKTEPKKRVRSLRNRTQDEAIANLKRLKMPALRAFATRMDISTINQYREDVIAKILTKWGRTTSGSSVKKAIQRLQPKKEEGIKRYT